MSGYIVKFTRLAREQLRNEMARSRELYGRDHQDRFLRRIVQRLSLVAERPQVHQIKADLGEHVRLFQERGLKIAYSVDHQARRVIVLVIAGRSREMQRAVDRALEAWHREEVDNQDDEAG